MEIDSDDDEEEEQKIFKNGSFSSGFLKSRNVFNLRLSTDSGTNARMLDTNSLPKKSPVTPYSRQTSSSDSQKSAYSPKPPQSNEWDGNGTTNGVQRPRRNSISSCYSITESLSAANEAFTMNLSKF
jgi:hypothetical protein